MILLEAIGKDYTHQKYNHYTYLPVGALLLRHMDLANKCVKLISRDNLKQCKFFAWSACIRLVHSLVILRARGCQFHCLSSYTLNVQINCAEGYKTNLINLENTYF